MVYFLSWLSSNLYVLLIEYIEWVYLVNRYLTTRWYFLSRFSIYSVSFVYMSKGGYSSIYLFSYLINLCQNPNYFNSASPLPKPFINFITSSSFNIIVSFIASSLILLSSNYLFSSSSLLLFYIISLNYFRRFSGPPILDAAICERFLATSFLWAIDCCICWIDFLFLNY